MKYYKYIEPARIDILANGFIRFTQPALFNDPFEMSPFISAIATDAEIDEIFHSQHEPHVREEYMKLNRETRRKISFEDFLKKYPKEILLPQIKESAKGKALAHVRESLSVAMSEALGILCVTTKFDNLLMWAHYAKSHEGMVIELDGENDFFHHQFTEPLSPTGIDEDLSKDYGYLKKVEYNKTRPEITISHVKSFDSFLIKGEEWAYEDEWRMLMPTAYAKRKEKDSKKEKVFLYEIPRTAITKVILGCRADNELIESVKKLKETIEELSHLQIEKMVLDEKDFRLISCVV